MHKKRRIVAGMNISWEVFDYFRMDRSMKIQPRWVSCEFISTVARYSPRSSGGGATLIKIFAFDTEYVLAGIGHWHGKPYRSAYFYNSNMMWGNFEKYFSKIIKKISCNLRIIYLWTNFSPKSAGITVITWTEIFYTWNFNEKWTDFTFEHDTDLRRKSIH